MKDEAKCAFKILTLWFCGFCHFISVFEDHAGGVCTLDCLPSLHRRVPLSGCYGESRVWLGVEVGMLVKKDKQMLVCEVRGMVMG